MVRLAVDLTLQESPRFKADQYSLSFRSPNNQALTRQNVAPDFRLWWNFVRGNAKGKEPQLQQN